MFAIRCLVCNRAVNLIGAFRQTATAMENGAANLVKGIVPGALVSERVQEELTERIWRETRVLHVDAVAPLMYLARALAMNHSWWQVELAIKVITSKLGLREKNELAQNAMCQDQYETFIQDMQEGLASTQTELMRFDSYAKSSAYQRICTMIANSKDSPEGLRSEQELILRSLRDAENNLQAVKRTVEDSSRLLNEAQMAETEQIQWSADMPRRKENVEDFFENMAKIKQNTSAKLEQDFQTAGQRMERILHETTELEKMAEQTEIKTVQQQRTLEEKQEELREVKEKLRRMKQGSDRHKNEYQAFKQDLEDERETVITRFKSAQRLQEGYLQQIEGFHQDLRQVLMEEVAWKMEQEALRKAEKAKNERKDAQDLYKDAQDRLRMGRNMVNELMRKNEEIAQLSQRAVEVEDEMTKLDELRQWLCEFGQPEVARGLKKFVKSKGEFTVPKVEKSNPIRLAMVLQRLVPRFCRRSKRKDALEREVTQDWCPGDAEHKRNKERRERCKVLMEQPDIQLAGENGFVLRTFYGHNTWRWRLFRSLSAPAKLWKDEGCCPAPKSLSKTPSGTTKSPRKSMAVSPEGQRLLSHRRGSKDHSTASPVSPAVSRRISRTETKAAPGRKALVPEDARGPRARQGGKSGPEYPSLAEDPGDFNFLSRWAAAPWSRIPVWEGDHGIAHFWQDCHLILQRLRKVICKNLEGLSHLQQLHSTIGNAQKILGDKKRRKAKSGGNNEEDREERDLAVASESARNLLDECREVLAEGVQHQQEQMWLCAMLLGQLCGLREALISTLGPLKVLGEEHEDLTLACRVLVHVSQFPQIQMEVISLGRHLHAWQRSVKLDLRQLQSQQVASSLPLAKLAAVTCTEEGEIFGVVYRQSLVSDSEEECRKGAAKKCFPFECRDSALGIGCRQFTAGSGPAYCGSHPFFGGYSLPDQVCGDAGPALWEEKFYIYDKMTYFMAATSSEIYLLPGYRDDQATIPKPRRCVLSKEDQEQLCVFLLVQEFDGTTNILKRGDAENGYKIEKAEVNCPEECKSVENQMIRLGSAWTGQGHRLVGLSKRSLWVMDLPSMTGANGVSERTTASDFASKVAWRKVMDLPQERTERKATGVRKSAAFGFATFFSDEEECPERMLAAGPQDNQVIIFRRDGSLHSSCMRPWLLVEMRGKPWGAEICTTRITSTASAWVAPSFSTDPSQRIVTFKFPGENGAGRSCLLSILMRFEYFQKALERWQESASSEIIVTDATTETFDLFLAYLHSGEVVSTRGLQGLLGLFELGNKYLLSHLVAICMAQILRHVADRRALESQKASLMADLLIAGESCSCAPFKFKIVDVIACAKPELTYDSEFLSRVSSRSVNILATLLSCMQPEASTYRYSSRKRRKIQSSYQDNLWNGTQGKAAAPLWSTTGVVQATPTLP
eukprot:symbB.v1.2.018430.t1/scaffold1470.1/size116919/13